MATATSSRRRRRLTALLAAAAAGLAAFVALSSTMATGNQAPRGAFSWLTPQAPPAGWVLARLPSGGASVAYPPGWRPIRTDPGTASVAAARPSGMVAGYLNVTPQSGPETLANWARFRPRHVAAEGARDVRLLAARSDVRFRSGSGSCVIDQYTTSRTSYREIACIATGAHGTNVLVAAAQVGEWARQGPLLERAVASFED